MARVSTYLNFGRNTEEAFTFYKSVFGTEFEGDVHRFKDIPPHEGYTPPNPEDAELIMHIVLPITSGHLLMGTDAPESMGFKLNPGNNVNINLEPDTLDEARRLFEGLSAGGTVEVPLTKMFWGDHFASFADKFGVRWMINCSDKNA